MKVKIIKTGEIIEVGRGLSYRAAHRFVLQGKAHWYEPVKIKKKAKGTEIEDKTTKGQKYSTEEVQGWGMY